MPNTATNSKGYKEIEYPNFIVLKSYNTIIAILNRMQQKIEETTDFYSQTTTRHLKLFKSRFYHQISEQKTQSYIDDFYNNIENGIYN